MGQLGSSPTLYDLMQEAARRSALHQEAMRRTAPQPMPAFEQEMEYYGGGRTTARELNASPFAQNDPFARQMLMPGFSPGTAEEQAIARIRQNVKEASPGAWAAMSPEERQAAAQDIYTRQEARGFDKGLAQGDIQVEAQAAMDRVQRFRNREFQYPTGEALHQDLMLIEAANRQTEGLTSQARATQIAEFGQVGPVRPGAIAMGAADMASAGLGQQIRSAIQPGTQGLETQVAEQAPINTMVGQFAGAAPLIGGVAGAGGRAAAQMVRTRGTTMAGQLAQGAAGLAGGFIAGEAIQAPIAYNQAMAQGASREEAFQAASDAALAYPKIAGKLISGDDLNEDDIVNLAFLLPEAIGALPATRPAQDAVRAKLADAAGRMELAALARQEALLADNVLARQAEPEAIEAMRPVHSQVTEPDPAPSRLSTDQPVTTQYPDTASSMGPVPRLSPEDAARRREASAAHVEAVDTAPSGPASDVVKVGDLIDRIRAEHPRTAWAVEGRARAAGDEYVLADVPFEKVELDEPGGGAGEIDAAKVQDYAGQPSETAPPALGVPGSEGKLLVVDGRHRTLAARLRGDETVKAYVPKQYAEQLKTGAEPQGVPDVQEGLRGVHGGQEGGVGPEVPRTDPQADRVQEAAPPDLQRDEVPPRDGQPQRPQEEAVEPPAPGKARKIKPTEWGERQPDLPNPRELRDRTEGVINTLKRPELVNLLKAAGVTEPGGRTNQEMRRQLMSAYDQSSEARSKIQKATEGRPVPTKPPAPRQAESDLDVLHKFVDTVIDRAKGDYRKVDYADLTNAELMRLAQRTGADRARQGGAYEHIRTQLENRGLPTSNITDKRIISELRKELPDGGAGSPARTPPQSAAPPRRREAPEVGSAGAAKAQSPKQVAQAAAGQGNTIASPVSPHRIIGDLNRKLGLGEAGVGRHKMLKTWALGFYRVSPEAIRLRMADMLDTHIHEVGHHLHKMIFQGGKTDRRVTAKGRSVSRTGLTEHVFPAAWRHELDTLGKALYGPRRPAAGYVSEGWAEFVRYLFTNEAEAQAKAPTVYKEATKLLAKEWGDQYDALKAFRDQYQLWNSSDPFTKAAGYIRRSSPPSAFKEWRLEQWDAFRRTHFDRTQPMVRLKKDLGLDHLPADMDPHVVALRTLGRATGDFKRAVRKGRFDPASGRRTGQSLAEVLAPVRKNMAEFETYLVLRRAIEKRAQGHTGVLGELSNAEIKQAVADAERVFPHFKDVADEFQKFNRWLIEDYAVANHLLTKEQADLIVSKNLDYVTFRKVATQSQGGGSAGSAAKLVDTGSGVKRFAKFAGEQVDPPIEAFMLHMQGIMNRAQANRTGLALHNLFHKADGIGRWMDKVDRPLEMQKLTGSEVRAQINKILKSMGIDPDDLDDTAIGILLDDIEGHDFKSFRPGFHVDKSTKTVTFLVNGKPEFYEIKNDALFSFLEDGGSSHAASALEAVLMPIRLMGRVKRAGATGLNPSFFLPNFVRDFFNALTFTATKTAGIGRESRIINAERARAVRKALLKGNLDEAYLASGADMAGLFGEYYDPKTKRIKVETIFEDPHKILAGAKRHVSQETFNKAWRDFVDGNLLTKVRVAGDVAATPIKVVFDPLARINNRFELANRMAEFEAVLAETAIRKLKEQGIKQPTAKQVQEWKARRRTDGWSRADLEKAGQAAADITLDYQRGGTAAKEINRYVPFFNAAMLGGDKLAREIRKDPGKFLARTINFIVIPTVAEHILNRDNEEYWNIPWDLRDRYWHIPVGDPDNDGAQEWIRIPRPYGLGSFAILTARAMAQVDGIDPVTGKRGDPQALDDIMKVNPMANALLRDFRPPHDVPIVTPLLELIFNYSLFYDNEIIWKGEQTGIPGERGAERSTELAAMFGSFMGIPPPQIDYAINGIFAGLGTDINKYAISPMLRAGREDVLGHPARQRRTSTRMDQPEDIFILKRFLFEEPSTFTESIARFYDGFKQLEDIHRSWRQREENPDRANEYYDRHVVAIEGYEILTPYKADMDKMFQQLREIYREQDLPADEFRTRTREITDEINKTAQDGMSALYDYRRKAKEG